MTLKKISLAILATLALNATANANYFTRSASFLPCSQFEKNCNDDTETSAEILYTDKAGKTLVYTDSPTESLGVVDITDLKHPKQKKSIKLGGEPTSVTIRGDYALVVVNTSKDYENVGGEVQVYQLSTLEKVTTLNLGGQPDSIAISPDQNYAVVAIENERDENKNDGALPQAPAGYAMIIDTSDSSPKNWKTTKVDLTGLATIGGSDPEPEYVDINQDNVAVMTLQENNHIVLIDLKTAKVAHHFNAGSVSLENIDLTEGKPMQISMVENKADIPREPDGVSWIDDSYFVTANEGDWKGGSRGFTIFDKQGNAVWDSGNTLDHMAASLGHYPDKRSKNKGVEPENVEVGTFGNERLLFVNAERAGLIFVYNVNDPKAPQFKQVLPAGGVGPEGGFALPSRNALFVASEVDSRDDKIRSTVSIYELNGEKPLYPTIQSADKNNLPVGWGALSGLASDKQKANTLYAIEDSFYKSNRIFTIDTSKSPAEITKATPIKDEKGLLANIKVEGKTTLVNEDKTVNIDPEGIATSQNGGFWIASEGKGTVGDEKKAFAYPNLLLKTDVNGVIEQVITLSEELNKVQLRFGFEGVAEQDGKVYVAFQRAWNKEENPRIGIYDFATKTWQFVFYPLDKKASQNGGWVGLSDLAPIGNGQFYVLERDNQGGPDAAIKRIYQIDLSNVKANTTIEKTLVRDLIGDLAKANGLTPEKVEGLTVTPTKEIYIINDNDGVDDNSGETQLLKLQ